MTVISTKRFTELTSVLSASIVEILNQSKSITKRLVECMPSCLGQLIISAIRENCDGTSCVVKCQFDPPLIRSQYVSMEMELVVYDNILTV